MQEWPSSTDRKQHRQGLQALGLSVLFGGGLLCRLVSGEGSWLAVRPSRQNAAHLLLPQLCVPALARARQSLCTCVLPALVQVALCHPAVDKLQWE